MPTETISISEAAERFLRVRATAGKKRNTLASDERTLRMLAAICRDKAVKNVTLADIEDLIMGLRDGSLDSGFALSRRASGHVRGRSLKSIQNDLVTLRLFFAWCRGRCYYPQTLDPMAGLQTMQPEGTPPKLRLGQDEFYALLTRADERHPRDRMIVALGLFLFLRESEVRALQWKHLTDSHRWIDVYRQKTDSYDTMPSAPLLRDEIRRWQRWLTDAGYPPQPEHYVIPRIRKVICAGSGQANPTAYRHVVEVERPLTTPSRIIKGVLEDLGYATDARSARGEGCHTLRRSGARALFDELLENASYDGALVTVAAMLGHKNLQTTEIYLGLDLNIERRNKLVQGEGMFKRLAAQLDPEAAGDNIVTIKREGTDG